MVSQVDVRAGARAGAPVAARGATHVCMYVPGVTDARPRRAAHALRDAGYRVTVIDIVHEAGQPAGEDVRGVRYRHVRMPTRFARYYQPVGFVGWILFKVLRILRGVVAVVGTPADIYHAHDLMALPACYLAARVRRKRLVYDAHELPLVEPHQTRHRVVAWVSARLLRVMLHRCAAVVTVSPPIVGELRRRYGGREAALVRNIPPYAPPVASDRLRRVLGLAPGARVALYHGLLDVDRGLDLLVRAAHDLAPHHHIVLMGQDNMGGALAELVAREGVGDRVHLLPAYRYDELLGWVSSADLGLLIYRPAHSPNVRYCLPNKLFEYLMAGVPVLASSLDAVVEVTRAYGVGQVLIDLEPAAIGMAIRALLEDDAARARMRGAALMAVRDDLCWERESARLVAVYDALPPARRRRGAGEA